MGDDQIDAGKKQSNSAGKRGRVAFSPSEQQRFRVMEMAADRLGHPVIAAEIGISVPTLRKAFAAELKERLGAANLFAAADGCNPEPAPAPRRAKRQGAGGRKRYEASNADREKVAVLVASGMTVDDIARAMSITGPTLRRHYRAEIETGALRKRGEMLVALHRTALKGNVAAQKEALAIMDRANLEALNERVRNRGGGDGALAGANAPAPAPDVGKKAQATLDAHGVVMQGPWADVIRAPQKAT